VKKRLYLVIENYNRELESRIYLAVRAAELGWSVVIGNKTNIVKQIKNLHSGVFFIKSIGPKNVEIINLLKEYSNKIVATDEENIVFFDDNHLLTRMNHNCLSKLDSFQTLQDSECIKAYCYYIAMIITIIIIIYSSVFPCNLYQYFNEK